MLARNLFFSFSLDVSIGVGSEIMGFSYVDSALLEFGKLNDGKPRNDLRADRFEFELLKSLVLGDIDFSVFRISEKECFLLAVCDIEDCDDVVDENEAFERCVDNCGLCEVEYVGRGSTRTGWEGELSRLNGFKRFECEIDAITELRDRCPREKDCSGRDRTGESSGIGEKWSSQATWPVGREMLVLDTFL